MPKAAIESPAESMTEQAMMPRFVDGSINLGELTIRLTEDVLNAIIIPEADQLCVGSANSATAIASTTSRIIITVFIIRHLSDILSYQTSSIIREQNPKSNTKST